jgi:hypothetical protein
LVGRHLGYVRVLAKKAFEVATDCCNGVGKGAREEMKEGFLFDRINVSCNDLPIDQADE